MSELGNALKEAREQKDMSLDDVQAITKIQKRYLLALEKGDYNQLPGDFYTRAFIKNYAEAVGLESVELFDTYQSELPKRQQDISQLPPRADRSQQSFHRTPSKFMIHLPKIIVILLLVGILVTIWVMLQKNGGSVDKGTTDTATHVQISGTIKNKNQSKDQTNSSNDQQTNQNQGQDQQKKDNNSTANAQSLKLDRSNGNTSYYTLSNTKTFILDISPINQKAKSWVEVKEKDQNGKKLFYGTVQKGNVVHLDLSNQKIIYVKVGSTPSTVIKINGKDFKFPNNSNVQHLYFTYKKS